MNNESNKEFHSVISAIQKVALYETKTVSSIFIKNYYNIQLFYFSNFCNFSVYYWWVVMIKKPNFVYSKLTGQLEPI